MLNRKILLAAAASGFLLAGGCRCDCHEEDDAAKAGASQSREKVAVVNSCCPIEPEHAIKGRMANPDYVVEWRGKKVGFCCEECPPEWSKMTDAQREAALAKAM